jgi:hypothetical protein
VSAAASVDLDVSVDRAWQALTDWAEQGSWMPLTEVDVVSGDGGLGTMLRARTGLGPISVVDDMVIDVWEPPHRAEVRHLGNVVTGRGVFLAEPLPGGRSRVTWIEEPSPEGWVAKMAAVTDPATRGALRVALARLAQTLRARG